MYGIRVNMRENERKRRTKSEIDAGVELEAASARHGNAGLELVSPNSAGPVSPTRAMQYSPTSTTSVASSGTSGPYTRTRARGLSRGSAHGIHGGMDLDERGGDY